VGLLHSFEAAVVVICDSFCVCTRRRRKEGWGCCWLFFTFFFRSTVQCVPSSSPHRSRPSTDRPTHRIRRRPSRPGIGTILISASSSSSTTHTPKIGSDHITSHRRYLLLDAPSRPAPYRPPPLQQAGSRPPPTSKSCSYCFWRTRFRWMCGSSAFLWWVRVVQDDDDGGGGGGAFNKVHK